MKARFQVTEMRDAEVSHISLVGKAASRQPFKVTKSEGSDDVSIESNQETRSMINLGNTINKVLKRDTAPAAPALAGLAVRKEDKELYAEFVTGKGFNLENFEDCGETLVYKSDEYTDEDVVGINHGDVVGIYTNVQKEFSSMSLGDSFMETLHQDGFFPSLTIAMDALRETVWNILFLSDLSKEEAAAKIEKASADFGTYVSRLASSLPEVAFKMDEEVSSVEPLAMDEEPSGTAQAAKDESEEGTEGDEPEASTDTEGTESEESEDEGDQPEGEPASDEDQVAPDAEEGSDPAAGEGSPEQVAKSDDVTEAPAWASEFMASVSSRLDELGNSVKGLAEKTDGLTEDLESVRDLTQKNESALGSIVPGSASADQEALAVKSDEPSDNWDGVLTEFTSKRQ